MFTIELISNIEKNKKIIVEEILKDSRQKWGDMEAFLQRILLDVELLAIARKDNGSLIAFSAAKRIIGKKFIAVAFLATRVEQEFRKRNIAKILVGKIIKSFVLNNKLINFKSWFKPAYFITATANPIVFETLRKRMNIVPSFRSRKPNAIEINIARNFSKIMISEDKFNEEDFTIPNIFQDSSEIYNSQADIPWSNNEETNVFLEGRIKLKEKNGDGIVVIGKIL